MQSAAHSPGGTNPAAPGPAAVDARRLRSIRRAAGVMGIAAAVIGLLVLVGWALDARLLTSVVPGIRAAKANTAVGIFLAGVSLWLLSPPVRGRAPQSLGQLLAFAAALLGALTLSEYLFGWDLGIDHLLFGEEPGAPLTSHPGRMAQPSTLSLVFLGAALLLLDVDAPGGSPAPWLALATALMSVLALTSYAFGASEVFAVAPYALNALPAAIGFLLIAFGVLLARPERRLVAVVASDTPGGLVARVLLPTALIVPLLLAWLRLEGQRAGLFQLGLGLSLLTVVNISVIFGMIWWSAALLYDGDIRRAEAEADVRRSRDELEVRVRERTAELARANESLQAEVAERSAAQQALRQERDFVSAVLDTVRALVVVLDRQGRMVRFNKACEEITGYSSAEVEGKPLWDFLLLPEEVDAVRKVFSALTAGQSPNEFENYWVPRSGDKRLIAWSNSALTEAGEVKHVIATGIDITERRAAENALSALNAELEQRIATRTAELQRAVERLETEVNVRERAEEEVTRLNEDLRQRAADLEAANKELESFSYSVSHDLRAPLRSIDGFSQAVMEDYADILPPEGKDYLERVRTASQRMGQLIDDILKLSRVIRAEMRREPVDLSALARASAEDLQQTDPDRPVEWAIAEGVAADGDPHLLRIVLDNLLGNAWKFTARQPNPRIEFGAMQQDGGTVYFVRDNGAGFDMAYVEKLFHAFQRLHSAAEFGGTGIGLATVQRIIRRHGGRVWAEGAVGKGATFYFTLEE